MKMSVWLQGFALGASLIIAIGAQNAFVLRQGLRRVHVFPTASICTLCDMALIALGVAGLGAVIAHSPLLIGLATWGGAAFLLYYGYRAFRAALRPGAMELAASIPQPTYLRATILATLAISLLNPHVYLDTVILLGSIGARYPQEQRMWFATGAMFASLVWFFGLAYGATWLAPLFQRPAAWRVLDAAVGCIMWVIAASLVVSGARF
jgi:L-lysine exporter family protein LysE/ArgO